MKSKLPNKISTRSATKYRGTKCLNCGQPLDLSDVYCPYCSQLNSTKQLSLKDFIAEFLNSLVVFDSRLRNTLKDLIFRPGIITLKYVNGQRLRYANPFRFFLSVSIIYFLLNGFIDKFILSSDNAFDPASFIQNDNPTKQKANEKTDDEKIVYSKGLLNIYGTGDDNKKTDTITRNKDSTSIEMPKYIAQKELDTLSWPKRNFEKMNTYISFYEKTNIEDPNIALDSLKHTKTSFNKWLYKKNKTIKEIGENPSEFFNYMMGKIPFFLFFFTPFFALFFWLIYSKEKYTYIEHIVFIFHIFSFLFLIMLIFLLPESLLGFQLFSGLLWGLVGPFYFYKALRNFYKQGRLVTILKFVFLNIVFFISSTIAATLFFALTAITY